MRGNCWKGSRRAMRRRLSKMRRNVYPSLQGLIRRCGEAGIDSNDVLQIAFTNVQLNRDKLPEGQASEGMDREGRLQGMLECDTETNCMKRK